MAGVSKSLQISPMALSCKLDDETVILDGYQYYTLNTVAARAWELLSDNADVELVIQRLEEEFDVGPATLRRDVTDWIAQMTARALLVEAS